MTATAVRVWELISETGTSTECHVQRCGEERHQLTITHNGSVAAAEVCMMKLSCLLPVTLFLLGTGACNRSSNEVPSDATTVNDAAASAGGGVNLQQPEPPIANAQVEDVQQDREALPSTASPLALAGLLGLLSLGAAMVARLLGRF